MEYVQFSEEYKESGIPNELYIYVEILLKSRVLAHMKLLCRGVSLEYFYEICTIMFFWSIFTECYTSLVLKKAVQAGHM